MGSMLIRSSGWKWTPQIYQSINIPSSVTFTVHTAFGLPGNSETAISETCKISCAFTVASLVLTIEVNLKLRHTKLSTRIILDMFYNQYREVLSLSTQSTKTRSSLNSKTSVIFTFIVKSSWPGPSFKHNLDGYTLNSGQIYLKKAECLVHLVKFNWLFKETSAYLTVNTRDLTADTYAKSYYFPPLNVLHN